LTLYPQKYFVDFIIFLKIIILLDLYKKNTQSEIAIDELNFCVFADGIESFKIVTVTPQIETRHWHNIDGVCFAYTLQLAEGVAPTCVTDFAEI
jgi:hypothetical protein